MEMPEKVQSSAGYNSGEQYYRADEMDPYIEVLKASLKEMVDFALWYKQNIQTDYYPISQQLDRARDLIKEVEG